MKAKKILKKEKIRNKGFKKKGMTDEILKQRKIWSNKRINKECKK